MQKRGLSTIIVTLILILVSIVAVGIVWVVVRNIIQTGTEGIGLSQFSLSAKILDVSVDNSSNNISLTVKRNAGKGELEGISFVFLSNADTEVVTKNVSLKELEQANFIFHLNMSVSDLISVSIVPLIRQDEKQITGIALDKYNFGKNQNTPSGQTSCTPVSNPCGTFICGNVANGTCGQVSCGSCSGGQICNSSGSCVANTSGNIIYALNCSYNEINNTITSAISGDTIIVPAGTCTWNNPLIITKGITLKGAGKENSIIKPGFTASNNYACRIDYDNVLISYEPATPSNDETMKIIGFTFDMNNKTAFGQFFGGDVNHIDTLIVGKNNFQNVTGRDIEICGTFYGVVYNNLFNKVSGAYTTYGENEDTWNNLEYTFGSDKILFYENNTIYAIGNVQDSGAGGRYVSRFNKYFKTSSGGWYPIIDSHGNQPGANHALMASEIYKNEFTNPSTSYNKITSHRGGKSMVWGNSLISPTSADTMELWEEYNDSINPPATGPGGQPQHVSDSYYWSNYRNGVSLLKAAVPIAFSGTATGGGSNYLEDTTQIFNACTYTTTYNSCTRYGVYITGGTGAGQFRQMDAHPAGSMINVTENWNIIPDVTSVYEVRAFDCCNELQENREFWNENTSFNGGVGIGVGTLANRPTTCTNGVGYWATDQGEWNSINPGADGQLYKCTSTNNWQLYYTPYIYPHPLTLI